MPQFHVEARLEKYFGSGTEELTQQYTTTSRNSQVLNLIALAFNYFCNIVRRMVRRTDFGGTIIVPGDFQSFNVAPQ